MISFEVDPSLHRTQSESQLLLDDGFSPPRYATDPDRSEATMSPSASSLEDALASKSDF